MQALVSDQGTGAILADDGRYYWLDESGQRQEISEAEVPPLLAAGGEFYPLPDVTLKDVCAELELAKSTDEALLLSLTLLDRESSREMRARAGYALEGILHEKRVYERASDILWARPLGNDVDFDLALGAAAHAPRVHRFLAELREAQPHVNEVWNLWHTLPESSFRQAVSREDLEFFVIRHGAFREAVRAVMNGGNARVQLRKALEKKTAGVSGADEVIRIWVERLFPVSGHVVTFPGKRWPKVVGKHNKQRSRKVGTVISDRMNKTVVVAVESVTPHQRYQKYVTSTNRFAAHDEGNTCRIGDRVVIEETRPLSRNKRWAVVEILPEQRRILPSRQ